jgi:hypothetical protein
MGCLAAGLLAAASASGCSDDAGDVPSLDGASAEASTSQEGTANAAEQARAADALVACLADQGIEAVKTPLGLVGHGDLEFQAVDVVLKSEEDGAYYMPGFGGTNISPDLPPPPGLVFDEQRPLLYDNGIDMTAQLVECVDSSGYFIPEPRFDPREEEMEKQAMAEAANGWAGCARENGMAGIVDMAVEVDNWDTVPEVQVPQSVSLEAFKDVLAVCPPLDPERDLTAPAMTEADAPRWVDPQIGFDLIAEDALRQQFQQALQDHISGLYESAQR